MKIVLLESLGISDELLATYAKKLEAAGPRVCGLSARHGRDTVQIERAKDADVLMIANMPLKRRGHPRLQEPEVHRRGLYRAWTTWTWRPPGRWASRSPTPPAIPPRPWRSWLLGMMLSLLRNVPQVDERCRDGQDQGRPCRLRARRQDRGHRRRGRHRRQNTAQLCCKAFGCRVHRLQPPAQAGRGAGLHRVRGPWTHLTREADIVSLNCPLNDEHPTA